MLEETRAPEKKKNRVEAGSQGRGQGGLTETLTSEGASEGASCAHTGDSSGKFWSSRETGVAKIT